MLLETLVFIQRDKVAGKCEWPRGLMRVLLGLRVRVKAGEMDVYCECFQVEVSTTGRSLVQVSPAEWGVS